ncbi:hypothetical protein [Sphingomonas sp. 1P08PE]|uniref:hypothetical protein n=1 Tax=Sphingomonas sp. 1P08PE TaxID=554122 RepID=UPI0039A30D17
MWTRIARLFVIKSKFEAFLVIYGLAVGATHRGSEYLHQYPGGAGWMLFGCCTIAVFMAGGRIIDAVDHDRERAAIYG